MLPVLYNNNTQIVQTESHVMIMAEMNHDARIIRMRDSEHSNTPKWLGDSIGYYEGDTLVVETTNFGEGVLLSHSGPGSEGIVHSDALKLIERYEVDENGNLIFSWEATDSNYLNGPMRGSTLLSATTLELGEYNCEIANLGERSE